MNYSSWDIKPTLFPNGGSGKKKIEFLIRYGLLAPSSHNTQPWAFKVKRNTLAIYADFKRRLPIADPTNRELFISLGCATANLQIAGRYFGFKTETKYLAKQRKQKLAAKILFSEKSDRTNLLDKNLFKQIPKRLTNRSLYQPRKTVSSDIKNQLRKIANTEGIGLHLINDRKTNRKLAELTYQGIKRAFGNRDFRVEVSKWIRHNWTKKGDGMPASTLGISDSVSVIAAAAIRSTEMVKETSTSERDMIISAPTIGVLVINQDNPVNWMKVGVTYQRLALLSTSHKVSTAILSAAIEMKQERKKLRALLKVKGKPALFFRIGYPKKRMPHSPRRPLEEVIVK